MANMDTGPPPGYRCSIVETRRLSRVVCAVALAAVGCGGAARANDRSGPVVDVVVRDFAMSAPRRVSAGAVTIRLHNNGPDDHEMIVVRAGGRLPLRRDAITIDEDALEHSTVVALEP